MDALSKLLLTQTNPICRECSRVFDMFDEDDANEWHYGHDCEA